MQKNSESFIKQKKNTVLSTDSLATEYSLYQTRTSHPGFTSCFQLDLTLRGTVISPLPGTDKQSYSHGISFHTTFCSPLCTHFPYFFSSFPPLFQFSSQPHPVSESWLCTPPYSAPFPFRAVLGK